METFSSLTENKDKSKNLTLGLTDGVATASAFATGHTGPTYDAAGANLGIQTPAGGGNLQVTQIPNFGKQLTASTNVNLVDNKNHKVDAHAYVTKNYTDGILPNYTSQGAGVNYSFKKKVGLEAATSYTPIAKARENSISTNINLHKTPNASLDFSAGASQRITPFGREKVESRGALNFKMFF